MLQAGGDAHALVKGWGAVEEAVQGVPPGGGGVAALQSLAGQFCLNPGTVAAPSQSSLKRLPALRTRRAEKNEHNTAERSRPRSTNPDGAGAPDRLEPAGG